MSDDQHVYYEVKLVIRDGGDEAFWRKHRNLEPDERLADYVRGLIDAGEAITKYGCESIEVARSESANSQAKPQP